MTTTTLEQEIESERTTPEDDNNATHVKIAAFAALVRQSSAGDHDDDNASLVSLDEERLGLLHGEEPIVGDARDEEEGGDDALKSVPSLLNGNDDVDALPDQDKSCCQFVLARIRANPSLSIATVFMGVLTTYLWSDERFRFIIKSNHHNDNHNSILHRPKDKKNKVTPKSFPAFPAKTLLGITVHKRTSLANIKGNTISQNLAVVEPPYNPTDFQYEKLGRNRTLTYWEEVVAAIEQSQYIQEDDQNDNALIPSSGSMVELWANITNWGPCYPRALPQNRLLRFKDETRSPVQPRNWSYIVQSNSEQITDEDSIIYPTYKKSYHPSDSLEESLGGLCRPGFLIIGQGKCGTSSLYHYLTGHPRILPAKAKQIHYFRYHKSKPLLWYYSHFPTIESFLGRGALMTGEASPGYMPYPSVVEAVVKKMSPDWKPSRSDGEHGVEAWKVHVRSLPKIIAVVRDPIERAKSSYKYNYIEPALKKLRTGTGIAASGERIPGRKDEQYYRQHHLFSFEELAYAELAALKECLELGGRGERWTYNEFGKRSYMFFYDSIQSRNNNNTVVSDSLPPLIHLDEACYTETNSKSAVPRAQWKELANTHPNKILALPNLQLTQSLIGRGIYALPLEWWYEVFSHSAANKEERIHVVCTEDMADTPESAMDDVTKFLGLPEFDFTNVTNVGRYNVGGHRGYDSITKSHDDDDDNGVPEERALSEQDSLTQHGDDVDLLAVSDALMNELIHFYQPYNERLFLLIGKRCPWK